MPTSRASAVWEGGLKGGIGRFEAGSGLFRGDYSFPTRFEGAGGTNPEELLAAAHAACFSMALAAALERAGTPAARVATIATVTLQKVDAGFRVTRVDLRTRARVPGVDEAAFQQAALGAKIGCPISQALQNNVHVELDAALE